MTRTAIRIFAFALLLAAFPANAQAPDGGAPDLDADTVARVTALLGRTLRNPETARYGRLRVGRADAFCGEVETTNRMGQPVGPRRFVADLATGFAGILPDAPELRNPATPEDYAAMRRVLALHAANCAT